MKKLTKVFIYLFAAVFICTPAFAQFDVNWGVSTDTGNFGYTDLDAWFDANGYGAIDAQTDYIGYVGGDADPFYWSAAPEVTFDVVARKSGFWDDSKFGYYTGSDGGKSLTQVLGLKQDGPTTLAIASSFGLYLNVPIWQGTGNADWFTDRGENVQQNTPTNPFGGDPQALIYPLSSTEWLIAWEDVDLTRSISDRDFNDAYLKLTVTPEPVSAALFLMGSGLLAVAGFRRKRLLFPSV